MNDVVSRRRGMYRVSTIVGIGVLVLEAIYEFSLYHSGVWGIIPFDSYLPHYVMVMAVVYDLAITAFPILITLDMKHAVRWGYLTIIFGIAGGYINNLAAYVFIVPLVVVGITPALWTKKATQESTIAS